MKINLYNPSFTGYGNIFADEIKYQKHRTLTLSMQVDNSGDRDLDNYKKLKSLIWLSKKEINNDTLTILYSKIDKENHFIFLNNKRLLWGEELLNLSESLKKSFQVERYKELENAHLKAYTFLANITRKIANGKPNMFLDENYYRTLLYTKDNLTSIFSNEEVSLDILRHGLYTDPAEIKTVANSLNHKIAVTMTKFFR